MTDPELEDYINSIYFDILLRNEFNELLKPHRIIVHDNCGGLDINLDCPISTTCISYTRKFGRLFREDEYLCFESSPNLYHMLSDTVTYRDNVYSSTTHVSIKHSVLLADPECFDKIKRFILHTKNNILKYYVKSIAPTSDQSSA